jgi:ubiquinone/menaquinone biosynthesis C-methylase UbiE
MPATSSDAGRALKSAHRAMWALGDYDRFARATVWELGPVLVEACGITRGQHVLDVAAGTGNVAIRAALAGASVVASDLTPEHFEAGRRAAASLGANLEWIEGDAEALPFGDGVFDVVTSCLGAMFAPGHRAVADELLRVCRPGGTIGMMNFTPEGNGGEFFALLAPYAPAPPPGADPPVLWGTEEHVRTLFGSRVSHLAMSRHTYVERAPSPADYCRLLTEHSARWLPFAAVLTMRRSGWPNWIAHSWRRSSAGTGDDRRAQRRFPTSICSSSPAARRPTPACRNLDALSLGVHGLNHSADDDRRRSGSTTRRERARCASAVLAERAAEERRA